MIVILFPVGSVTLLDRPVLNIAWNVDSTLEIFWNEIVDLCMAVKQLVKYSFDDLFVLYRRELERGMPYCYLQSIQLQDRIIGCLDQNFRCRSPLNRKLDNREIVLVLCDLYSLTNYNFSKKDNYIAQPLSSIKAGVLNTFKFTTLPLLPSRYVQATTGSQQRIKAVYYGSNPYPLLEIPGGQLVCMSDFNNNDAYKLQFDGGQPLIDINHLQGLHQPFPPPQPLHMQQSMYSPFPAPIRPPPGLFHPPMQPQPFFGSPLNGLPPPSAPAFFY